MDTTPTTIQQQNLQYNHSRIVTLVDATTNSAVEYIQYIIGYTIDMIGTGLGQW